MLTWAVTAKTAARYTNAAERFVQWVTDTGDDAATAADFDALLVEYCQYLFESGHGKSLAAMTLSGLLHFCPWLVHELPMARRALKGWTKRCPSVPWPPVTWPVAVAVAVRMVINGSMAGGIGVLLAFDCLLRVGELVSLRACDIVEAGDKRVGGGFDGMWLRLARTKTGTNKSVRVRSEAVRVLVRRAIAGMPPTNRLYPFTVSTFRRSFKVAAAQLGVSSDVVVHSLRHGGATHLFTECKMDIAAIAEHGRWASVDSARHYLQACRALLMAREAEPIVDLGRRLMVDVVLSMSLAQKHVAAAAAAAARAGRCSHPLPAVSV